MKDGEEEISTSKFGHHHDDERRHRNSDEISDDPDTRPEPDALAMHFTMTYLNTSNQHFLGG